MSAHKSPEATLSPKVLAPLALGLGLTVLGTFLASITPETLTALGPFAFPVATALATGGGYLVGYLKRDHLREVGAAAVGQGGVTPSAAVADAARREAQGMVPAPVAEHVTIVADQEPVVAPVAAEDGSPVAEPAGEENGAVVDTQGPVSAADLLARATK